MSSHRFSDSDMNRLAEIYQDSTRGAAQHAAVASYLDGGRDREVGVPSKEDQAFFEKNAETMIPDKEAVSRWAMVINTYRERFFGCALALITDPDEVPEEIHIISLVKHPAGPHFRRGKLVHPTWP